MQESSPSHRAAMNRLVVGLTGFARSGKDSTADVLVTRHGFTKIALADALRDVAYDVDPLLPSGQRLATAVDEQGWEGLKADPVDGPELRRLLIQTGMAVRDHVGSEAWIEVAGERVKQADGSVVVSDVRLAHEAEAIRSWGGVVLQVTRPGVGPAVNHITEKPLPDDLIDYRLSNNGSLDRLRLTVSAVVAQLVAARIVQP